MSKVRLPSQKSQYAKLNKRLVEYIQSLQTIYEGLNKEASGIALMTDFAGEGEFKFSDYPITNDRLKKLQQKFVREISALIYSGTSEEWKKSNLFQDLIADKVIKAYTRDKDKSKHQVYYQANNEALKAFQERKDNGMNLSQKLWNQSEAYKTELEDVLSVSIEKGIDAVTLSKKVSKYLNDFDTFKSDYEEKFGHATKVEDCEYRSIRLARSEINMSYRTAEQKRWKQFDFVLGYEIKLSHAHPRRDICDELVGKYPKDFVWTGWHPNCMDYCVPILMSEDEFFSIDTTESPNEVKDVPEAFDKWCSEHSEAIAKAKERNTLPYFLRDNQQFIKLDTKKAAHSFTFDEIEKTGCNLSTRGVSEEEWLNSKFCKIDFGKLKGDIEGAFKSVDNSYGTSEMTVSLGGMNGEVRILDVNVRNESSTIRRYFTVDNEGAIVANHQYFNLPTELQGKGIAKDVLSAFLEQYEKIGVDKIELLANIDVGGYAWAKYGFSTNQSAVMSIVKKCSDSDIKDSALSIVESFYSKHKEQEMFPMRLLADQEYGKKLLLGTNWMGELDLHDKEAVAIFKKYLSSK